MEAINKGRLRVRLLWWVREGRERIWRCGLNIPRKFFSFPVRSPYRHKLSKKPSQREKLQIKVYVNNTIKRSYTHQSK